MGNSVLIESARVEENLLAELEVIRKRPSGRSAIQLRLSALASGTRADDHRKAVDDLVQWVAQRGGTAYALSNGDVIALCKGARANELERLTATIEAVFRDVPRRPDIPDQENVCIWFDLTVSLQRLLVICDQILLERRAIEAMRAERQAAMAAPPRPPLDPASLSRLEAALGTTEIDRFVRNRAICRVPTGKPSKPVSVAREVYVRVEELEQVMTPGVDLGGHCWLFLHLATLFDQRMLMLLLRDPDALGRQPTWINLRLSSVLSPEFNRLARLMTDTDRRNLTVELNAVDLMADYDGYLFVRSYLSDIGVKVCLDGTDQHSLPALVDAGLAADMIKIRWSRDGDMVALTKPDHAFAQAIAAFGPVRAVLCGCSEARAIEFGHALGLDLFQGRYVDQLMNPNAIRMA